MRSDRNATGYVGTLLLRKVHTLQKIVSLAVVFPLVNNCYVMISIGTDFRLFLGPFRLRNKKKIDREG